MKTTRVNLICCCVFGITATTLVCFASAQSSDRAAVIPLDQVWANDMPGTKDIKQLIAETEAQSSEKRWTEIALSLCADASPHWPRKGETSTPAFVVAGSGRTALDEAYQQLTSDKPAQNQFTTTDELTLAFFIFQNGAFAELQNVQRNGHTISVAYRLIRPVNKIQSAHLALIPLGKLSAGEYRVEVEQNRTGEEKATDGSYGELTSPRPDVATEKQWGRRFVSGSFSFRVSENEQ